MLKLKPDPTFRAKVDIPVAGGDAVPVEFEFRHKTLDQLQAWLRTPQPDDVQGILDIAVGWELAEPLNAETVALLVQNHIGCAGLIARRYADELTKARLGN
jgi:hypothetical protein